MIMLSFLAGLGLLKGIAYLILLGVCGIYMLLPILVITAVYIKWKGWD